MEDEKRLDTQLSMIVNAGVEIGSAWGTVPAWRYLSVHRIAPEIAARVLSRNGPRRTGDSLHPAVRDARARAPELGLQQRAQDGGAAAPTLTPRTNIAAAAAVERAIQTCATQGRYYAESLLRIQGLPTTTIMRVLFQPQRRRRGGAPE